MNFFSSKSNKEIKNKEFGEIPFITFYLTVLARLSYLTSENFIQSYVKTMGPIIPLQLMQGINNCKDNNTIFNDEQIYNLSGIQTFTSNNKKFVDFTGYAKKFNDLTMEISYPEQSKPSNTVFTGNYTCSYISVATSNYSGIYVLVDTRMPNSIFVLFRGTYSAKSAGSYTKPNSLVPYEVAKYIPEDKKKQMLMEDEGKIYGVLKGIDKILEDSIHTIVEGMVYLSKNVLKQSNPNNIKVFTTGHSLGGALTTLFAQKWSSIKKDFDINNTNLFSDNIICVSIASPRVLSKGLSNNFCKKTVEGKIIFKRITTRGDPVPALPSASLVGLSDGYMHPCSDKKYKGSQREVISLDCSSVLKPNLTRPGKSTVDYNASLKCRNTKTSMLSGNISGNVYAHLEYLYVKFANGVSINELLKSASFKTSKSKTTEIKRSKDGETQVRMILGDAVVKENKVNFDFKDVFYNLNRLRNKKIIITDEKNNNFTISTDSKMSEKTFNNLILQMKEMKEDLNPTVPDYVFNILPDESIKNNPIRTVRIRNGGYKKTQKNKKKTMKKNKKNKRSRKTMRYRKR